jgi:integrase
MEHQKLNEGTVESLPIPERGHRIHYFPDAIVNGVKAPRGFGVRVTQAGVRTFILRRRVRDGRHADRTLTIGRWPDWKVPAAVREARDLRKRLDNGEDPIAELREAKATALAAAGDTLRAISENYMEREGGKLRSAAWREAQLKRLVYPTLGARPIGDIKRSEIVKLLDAIEKDSGATMATATLAIIRKIFNWHATRSDDFRSPIVRGMARTKSKEQARSRILTDGEIRALWKQADTAIGADALFGRFMKFLILTGARRSEASALKWVELDGTDWTLPASRNKTKVELVRPLSKAALAILPGKIGECEFVFTTDGKRPIGGFSQFKSTVDDATGIEGWTLHDLRRTARSLMSRAQVPSDHAEHCLGHIMSGVRGVYDRHEYHDEKKRAYEALASLIELILNPQENVTPLRDGKTRA